MIEAIFQLLHQMGPVGKYSKIATGSRQYPKSLLALIKKMIKNGD